MMRPRCDYVARWSLEGASVAEIAAALETTTDEIEDAIRRASRATNSRRREPWRP